MVSATTKVIQVESQQKHQACSIKGGGSIPEWHVLIPISSRELVPRNIAGSQARKCRAIATAYPSGMFGVVQVPGWYG